MKIDNEIKMAINELIKSGKITKSQLAKKAGCAPSSVEQWLNGRTKSMSDDKFSRIYPMIKTYLPNDKVSFFDSIVDSNVEGSFNTNINSGIIDKVQSEVMACDDIPDPIKVIVYNLLQKHKTK